MKKKCTKATSLTRTNDDANNSFMSAILLAYVFGNFWPSLSPTLQSVANIFDDDAELDDYAVVAKRATAVLFCAVIWFLLHFRFDISHARVEIMQTVVVIQFSYRCIITLNTFIFTCPTQSAESIVKYFTD